MKTSVLMICSFTLLLAIITTGAEDNGEYLVMTLDGDNGRDDDMYVLLDDDEGDDKGAKALDIRSIDDEGGEDADEGDEDDDDLEIKNLEKRSWSYKCSDSECKVRCVKLLKLPDGQCGNGGKCYCRRKAKTR